MSDLSAAKTIVEEEHYSQALFLLEQSFEKCLKSLYCYYRIVHDGAKESEVHDEVFALSHNIRKALAKMLLKACEIEEKNIDIILQRNTGNKQVSDVALIAKRGLSGFRQSISRIEKPRIDKKKLVEIYPDVVAEVYNQCMDTPSVIQQTIKKLKSNYSASLSEEFGKDSKGSIRSFVGFIGASISLATCLLGMESAARYPLKEMNYANLERLNRKDMDEACKQLILMLTALMKTVPYMMRLE